MFLGSKITMDWNDAEAKAPILWPLVGKNWLNGKDPDTNSWVEALITSVMVFGSGVFGRYLNLGEVMELEVEPPGWDWCPYKRMQRPEFCSCLPSKKTRKSIVIRTWPCWHLQTSQPPEQWEIHICCLKHSINGIWLITIWAKKSFMI